MNADYSNRSDREGNRKFQTHRSDRYRFPERDSSYHFDDYGSSARGGYGNEGYSGTWGNQGNEMGGSRNNDLDRDLYGSYRSSRNYGSMGSYGGAQGYGDSRGGQHRQGRDYNYYSGEAGARDENRGYERNRSYGYQSDYDSHGSGFRNDSSPDLYGSDTSRRFQGSDQGRYDFDRDNYNRGSGSQSYSRDRDRDRDRSYNTSGGSYMGSGYNRTTRGDYDTGNYGSMGSYDRGSSGYGSDRRGSGSSYGEYQGMSGNRSRQTRYPNDSYARDSENTRIQHRDSDYDYDPNHSFDVHKDPYYFTSHNRGRTWDRSRDFDRY